MVFVVFLAIIGPAGYWAGRLSRPARSSAGWPPNGRRRRTAPRRPGRAGQAGRAQLRRLGRSASVVFARSTPSRGRLERESCTPRPGTLLAGLACAAVCYLLTERFLRPVFARVLAGEPPDRSDHRHHPRLMLSWALGSAVPLIGIAIAPLHPADNRANLLFPIGPARPSSGSSPGASSPCSPPSRSPSPSTVVGPGWSGSRRATSDRRCRWTTAARSVCSKAGFNRMAGGPARARTAARTSSAVTSARRWRDRPWSTGGRLGGEQREASVLFVDLIGSTAIAQNRAPGEVVAMLNDFFGNRGAHRRRPRAAG